MKSNYYKYNFVSPVPLYALIQEELDSYFNAGMVDDLLFSKWTDKCLKRLGKSSYSIQEAILHLEDFQDRLPDNFDSVKEAWLLTPGREILYPSPVAEYRECISSAILVNSNEDPYCPKCEDDCKFPESIRAVYKFKDTEVIRYYGRTYLLKPGSISTKEKCHNHARFNYSSPEEFDIHGNKFTTNFREGIVHLLYYGIDYTDEGYQLIPDDYWIQEYIESFIKYKVFEKLMNTSTDETAKQIAGKVQFYKQQSDEAFVSARAETIRETVWKKQRAIKRVLNYNKMYELADSNHYGCRR